MRKSRFSEEQMVRILREADKTSVAAAAKKHKVSEQTIYTWRKSYGGVDVAGVKELKALRAENARLKRIVAERDLEIDVMKEIAAKIGERTCPSRPGPLRPGPRPVVSTRMCAAQCCEIRDEL